MSYYYVIVIIQDIFDDDEIKPPRNRTSSDPNPPNKPVQKIIKPSNGGKLFSSIDNPLDWKFGQRSSTKELQIRGIIPEQYADVVHGNKSLEQAKSEWEAYKRQSTMKIKNKIDLITFTNVFAHIDNLNLLILNLKRTKGVEYHGLKDELFGL